MTILRWRRMQETRGNRYGKNFLPMHYYDLQIKIYIRSFLFFYHLILHLLTKFNISFLQKKKIPIMIIRQQNLDSHFFFITFLVTINTIPTVHPELNDVMIHCL